MIKENAQNELDLGDEAEDAYAGNLGNGIGSRKLSVNDKRLYHSMSSGKNLSLSVGKKTVSFCTFASCALFHLTRLIILGKETWEYVNCGPSPKRNSSNP